MKKTGAYAVRACLMIAGFWFFFLLLAVFAHAAGPVIIDHFSTDIRKIPESAIQAAKNTLHIAYGHTSHGSQLISGMGSNNGLSLDQFMTANGSSPGLYRWNNGGTGGALDLHDYFVPGDLGNPDRTAWAQRTREYLNNPANSDVNVVMWSWCGQAATSIANIDIYLNLMEGLIADYPNVSFVFMTGHLDGTGPSGLLNLANEHIRNHCRTNNRILFDFADIESYDPDGQINYMEYGADDGCYYDRDGNGSRESNWALDWQAGHVQGLDWWASGAAHSQHLNGNLKGYAAWWLWARLAGWGDPAPCVASPSGLMAALSPQKTQVRLSWSDNSTQPDETGFIIQRREKSGSWNNDFARVGPGVTQYTDTQIAQSDYSYRVAAYAGMGPDVCISSPSNMAQVQISDPIFTLALKQGVAGYQGCRDTYLDSGSPGVNFGNTLYKNIGALPQTAMAIQFDLPETLMNKSVHQARLKLYCWSVSNFFQDSVFKLYPLAEPWDENSATWVIRNSAQSWASSGGTREGSPICQVPIQNQAFYPEFDVTQIVQQWALGTRPNNGLILVNDSRTVTGIKASEYSEYGRPSLEIRYSEGPDCRTDKDLDTDTDGLDMAWFATGPVSDCLERFANEFGK